MIGDNQFPIVLTDQIYKPSPWFPGKGEVHILLYAKNRSLGERQIIKITKTLLKIIVVYFWFGAFDLTLEEKWAT